MPVASLLSFSPAMQHLLYWVIVGAFVDAMVGVVSAVVKGGFDLQKIGGFLVTNVGAVLLPVVAVGILATSDPSYQAAFQAACLAAYATFLGSIAAKIGIPLKIPTVNPNALPNAPPPKG